LSALPLFSVVHHVDTDGLTLSRPSPTARMTRSARSPPPPSSVRTDKCDLYSSNREIPLITPAGSRREKKCSCSRQRSLERWTKPYTLSDIQPFPALYPCSIRDTEVLEHILPTVKLAVIFRLSLFASLRILLFLHLEVRVGLDGKL
jgi:hypothetical protein